MRNYTWFYGIFHWFMHYFLTIMLWWSSGITLFPSYISTTLFGILWEPHVLDYVLVIVISSLIDLDHLPVLKKFGFKRYILAEKRFVSPLHNFFFLSVLSILSSFSIMFVSRKVGVFLFSIVLHLIWDIFEDVVIFRTSFRRWEKTWGLDTQDLEEGYNELLQIEAQQPKKESRIKKIGAKLKERGGKLKEKGVRLRERIRRKKAAAQPAVVS